MCHGTLGTPRDDRPDNMCFFTDMIRQRAQAFKSYFKDKKPENAKQSDDIDHSSHGTYLNMESFPSQNIPSVNNEFLGELMMID